MPSPVLTLLKEITLNLDKPNDLVYVTAKQYDMLARKVKISLLHNDAPWVIPAGLSGVIRYIKPDNTRGMYDTDDDNNPAIVITTGSSAASPGYITITLARQVLTAHGQVKIEVSLYSAAAEKLTTFSFPLVVEEAALSDIPFYESEDYFNFRSDMATIQQLNQAFASATQAAVSGTLTIDNTLSIEGAIADAKAAGDMVMVSEDEPEAVSNILWIKDPQEEIEIPTMEDFNILKSTINDNQFNILYPQKWNMNKTVNGQTGDIENSNFMATSDEIYVYGGDILFCGRAFDNNGVPYICNISQYKQRGISPRFIERIVLPMDGTPITLDENTEYIRISFGRTSSTAIEIDEDDVVNFSASNYFTIINTAIKQSLTIPTIQNKIDSLEEQIDKIGNIYSPSEWDVGFIIDGTSGVPMSNQYYSTSEEIAVFGKNICYCGELADSRGIPYIITLAEYRSISPRFVQRRILPTDGTSLTLDDSTIAIRFSFGRNYSYGVDASIDDINDFMAATSHGLTEEVNNIADKVDSLEEQIDKIGNIYSPSEWDVGFIIDGTSGVPMSNQYYSTSQELDVLEKNICYCGELADSRGIPYIITLAEYRSIQPRFVQRRILPTDGTPLTLDDSTVTIRFSFGRHYSYGMDASIDDINDFMAATSHGLIEKISTTIQHISNSINPLESSIQINDGLNQTAACASGIAYDKEYGLVFVTYQTGLRTSYGESNGKIYLAIFNPSQPTNIKWKLIDNGNGTAQGLLCNSVAIIGDAKVRIYWTITLGTQMAYYRDYDFLNDILSEKNELYLKLNGQNTRVNYENCNTYVTENGYVGSGTSAPHLNKVFEYNNELYTAISRESSNYPILCKIVDDVLEPFAVCSVPDIYEFRYYVDETAIHAVYRVPIDDLGVSRTGYATSTDNGETWTNRVFSDGIQSRPEIIPYYGKPLIIYNYRSYESPENFPYIHNNRNAIKMVYEGNTVFQCFTKYGIVEPSAVDIHGDIYLAFSDNRQALMVENGQGWNEDGHIVENAKECLEWAKIGYLLQ